MSTDLRPRYATKAKETEWFDGRSKPVRAGVYRRVGIWVHQFGSENISADGYAYWNGTRWYVSKNTPLQAVLAYEQSDVSAYQPNYRPEFFNWLGLKEQA